MSVMTACRCSHFINCHHKIEFRIYLHAILTEDKKIRHSNDLDAINDELFSNINNNSTSIL